MKDRKQIHNEIAKFLYEHGESCNKKHGSWIIFYLPNGTFLQMDSWNKSITQKTGDGDYDYWSGFSGSEVQHYGMDFGGYSFHATYDQYRHLLELIKGY